MLTLEFHCHTIYSPDSLTRPADLVAVCARKGIDRVVVTDHNTIAGALEAHTMDPQRVIVGEEVMTTQGELLAAFVREEVPPGLSPMEAIARLRDQGAFISVSHPFDMYRKGHWEVHDLEQIAPYLDAIEIFNARCLLPDSNRRAEDFAHRHNLIGTVGSDAHTLGELGRALQILPDFSDAVNLRASFSAARSVTRLSSPLIHLTSRWAVWVKKLRRMNV
ncbi:MAG: PHP domain-containing protein [Anaerolineales bacterium]|nr:PHP domain-containing protein [Anaerolineales bacterium]